MGEAFALITGQTGLKGRGWRSSKNVCFPEKELCLEKLDLESLAKLRVSTVESPERETSAARPSEQDPWEVSGRCSWSRGCLWHVGIYPTAQDGSWSLPFPLRGKRAQA